MVYVVPAFQGVFASFGAELPLLTRMVMGSSDALRQQGVWLLIGTCLGALVLRYVWKSRPHIRYRLQTLALQIPWLGPLWRKACLARWSRTLATLFGAGVPLMEALDGVAGAAGHALYQNATQRIRLDVATGIPLSQAMQRTAVFPPMLLQMSAIGEASGALESMLAKAADFYEQDVDETVAQLSSLIEPLLIVSLGAIIGTIVVAMYLPIFSLGHIV
jgi:type IV pilus assembly protein PilC